MGDQEQEQQGGCGWILPVLGAAGGACAIIITNPPSGQDLIPFVVGAAIGGLVGWMLSKIGGGTR